MVSVLPTALLSCALFQEWRMCWEQQCVSLSTVCDGNARQGWRRKEKLLQPPSKLCVFAQSWMLESESSHHKERLGKVLSFLNQCFM